MIKEGNFGVKEAIAVTTIAITTKILYTTTARHVEATGTAAWYIPLLALIITLFMFYMLCILMKRFPNNNLIEIFDMVLGKFFGKLASVSLSAYLIYYSGSILREFLEMIKAYNLPNTSPSIILISFMLVCTLGVYLGLEAIVRLAYVMVYILAFGLIFMYLLALPEYNVYYLMPYLGYGIKTNLYYGMLDTSLYSEIIILAVMINSLQGYKYFKKAGMISLLISGFIFSISLFCYVTAFGYNMGQENLSGIFQLSKLINISRFFQRVESVFIFDWVINSLITVSISLYISLSIYCKAFNIKKIRPLLLPLVFSVYLISLLPANLIEVIQINLTIIRRYSFILIYGLTLLTLLISLIRGKKGEQLNVKKN